MKCGVCSRESGKETLCKSHSIAHKEVAQGYEIWRKGLRISWEDYLRRIRDNSLTGKWAKEVAEYLIDKEEKENVEKS